MKAISSARSKFGRPVVAPLRDIQEARNAIKAYEEYQQWDPASEADLLSAHEVLLSGLLDAPGHYRRTGIGMMGSGAVHHIDQVSDQVARLLAILRTGPKTAAELMAALGLSHRPTFRKNYLRPALSAGLVEMTRPESPTAKNQKYRLAVRGREM